MTFEDEELDQLLDRIIDSGDVAVVTQETDEADATAVDADAAEPLASPATVNQGRRPHRGQPLFFDLETIPDYSRVDSFGLSPVPEVPAESDPACCPDIAKVVAGTVAEIKVSLSKLVAPPHWLDGLAAAERTGKDRGGVHDLIAASRSVRQNAIDAHADRIKLLSTTPEYCSIAAIGWAEGDTGEVCSLVAGDAYDGGQVTELDVLATFWSLAARHSPLVAYNGIGFDLPVIFVRSAILGVPSSRMLDLRPWGADIVDPYLLRFGSKGNTDQRKPGKLKSLAPLYGIEVPAEGVDGSQVHELAKTNPALLGEYVRSDVAVLRSLYRSLRGYFWS